MLFMEVLLSMKENKKVMVKNFVETASTLGVMALLISVTGSTLIASVLGTTTLKVAQVLRVAYKAYKAGSGIRAAIAGVMGPGAAVGFLVSVVVGYGFSAILDSPGLQSY